MSATPVCSLGGSVPLGAVIGGGGETWFPVRRLETNHFEALARLAADADVLCFGEADHLDHDQLILRNTLFHYLVEHHGYRTITLETGMSESRLLYDFVQGKSASKAALEAAFTWGFGKRAANLELVEMVRSLNDRRAVADHIHILGFDVPGSLGVPNSVGLRELIASTLAYVERFDPDAASDLRTRFAPLECAADIGDDLWPVWSTWPEEQKRMLDTARADLKARIEGFGASAHTSEQIEDLRWARRAIQSIDQARNWLASVDIAAAARLTGRAARLAALIPAERIRDHAQAENILSIVEEEQARGKILVYASRKHLSALPLTRHSGQAVFTETPAGNWLRQRLGDRVLFIAMTTPTEDGSPEAQRPGMIKLCDLRGDTKRSLPREVRFKGGVEFFTVPGDGAFDALLSWSSIENRCEDRSG